MKKGTKILAMAGTVAALGVSIIPLSSYAATTNTATITVRIGETLAMTVNGGEVPISSTVNMSANATDETIEHTINVATNNTNGYNLTVIDQDEDNTLKRDSSHYISPITEGAALVASTPSWGYKVKTGDSYEANYHPIPTSDDVDGAAVLRNNDGTNITTSSFNENTYVKYGIATGSSVSGEYTDTVVYTVTGNPSS